MPLSAAEKQRRYRERLNNDPVRREAYLNKERQRWEARKRAGTIKTISQCTPREQRQRRRSWRTHQAKCRQRKMMANRIITPPASPQEHSMSPEVSQFPQQQGKKKDGRKNRGKKVARQRYFNQYHTIPVAIKKAKKYK